MRVGASTFIWVSPFSNKTLDLIDRVKAFGFDLIYCYVHRRSGNDRCRGY